MDSKRLSEVSALVSSAEFVRWWKELQQARAESEAAKRDWYQLLSQVGAVEAEAEVIQKEAIETLDRADGCEHAAAAAQAQAAELENKSFRAVSEFEQQRFRASETWYRLGGSEKELDELREAYRRAPNRKSESELQAAERSHRHLTEQYARDTERKEKLWREVEQIWTKSAETNLVMAEQRVLGRKVRSQAEGLFAAADERRKQTTGLRGEAERGAHRLEAAEKKIRATLDSAKQQFGAGVGTDFLYFRVAGNQEAALCVSLIADRENYNLELQPLSIYSLDSQIGVAHLEPARENIPTPAETNSRFESV
jgi:hypothetical protein